MIVRVALPNGVVLDSGDMALCDLDNVLVTVTDLNQARIEVFSTFASTDEADPPPSRPNGRPGGQLDGVNGS